MNSNDVSNAQFLARHSNTIPVIPAPQEVEEGELQSEVGLCKASTRPYLKNKLKAKGTSKAQINW
jgi:hypothetical protein